eukprot:249521-Hanusia_phi.AAC.1
MMQPRAQPPPAAQGRPDLKTAWLTSLPCCPLMIGQVLASLSEGQLQQLKMLVQLPPQVSFTHLAALASVLTLNDGQKLDELKISDQQKALINTLRVQLEEEAKGLGKAGGPGPR